MADNEKRAIETVSGIKKEIAEAKSLKDIRKTQGKIKAVKELIKVTEFSTAEEKERATAIAKDAELEAEAKAGEIYEGMPKSEGARGIGKKVKVASEKATPLSAQDYGITRQEAHEWVREWHIKKDSPERWREFKENVIKRTRAAANAIISQEIKKATGARAKYDFWGYNVWGFKNDSWRNLIVEGDPNQPDANSFHGATPAFVIHQLIEMFEPKKVLDNMAGTGTTGYVCEQHKIEYDLFDLNAYPKYKVRHGDAENTPKEGKYDLIFNHLPYLNMVRYSETKGDMSLMNEQTFYEKLKKIMAHNRALLNEDGVYAILIGDPRANKQIIPLTAKTTEIGIECGFKLFDEAIKLTAEQKSTGIQEYRASKYGYLAQTFDTVLIFRKV